MHGLHGLHGGKKRLNKHIFHAISRHAFFIYFSQKPARLPPSPAPPEVWRPAWSACLERQHSFQTLRCCIASYASAEYIEWVS